MFISNSSQYIQGDTPTSHPYLLRLNKYGYHVWPDPIEYGGLYDYQSGIRLIPDGSGGAISVYIDGEFQGYDDHFLLWDLTYRAMRMDSQGNQVWDDYAIVSDDTLDHRGGVVAPDDSGGFYINWISVPELGEFSFYEMRRIQHISSAGERLWGENGITLFEGDTYQRPRRDMIIADGTGGVIMRYCPDNENYFYKRLDYAGNTLWEIPSRMYTIYLVNDHNGGLIALGVKSYFDFAAGTTLFDILADIITPDGDYAWDSVKTVADSTRLDNIRDGYFSGDSIISFFFRTGHFPNGNCYFHSFDINGNILTEGDGVVPSTVSIPSNSNRLGLGMIQSLDNTYLCLFIDNRTGEYAGLYLQRINTDGDLFWSEDVLVSSRDEKGVVALVPTNDGGAIIVWKEGINGTWAQQVSRDGVLGDVLAIEGDNQYFQPNQIHVYQNYPNPFNPATTIAFDLPETEVVKVAVYNMLGQKVTELVNRKMNAGHYTLRWEANDRQGQPVSAGVYFVRLQAGDFQQVRKVVLLK